MRYANAVSIRRSIGEVFAYLTAVDTAPIWHSRELDVRKVRDTPLQEGSRLAITARLLGRELRAAGEVTLWDPPRAVKIEVRDGILPLALHLQFTDEDGNTEVATVTDVRVGGTLNVVAPLIESTLRRQAQAGLEGAKALLEMEGAPGSIPG